MLKLYRGSDTTLLADRLVEWLGEHPPGDPLEAESFVVQNHGMAQWLTRKLATQNGIAANLSFKFPAEKVWELYRTLDPSIPAHMPSDREPMTWAIYRELAELPDSEPFGLLYRYTRDENGAIDVVKAWKLAHKIGDLFDRYLVYRQEWLFKWESAGVPGDSWQPALWNRLKKRWGDQKHRAAIHREFMERLENNSGSEDALPERLILFGLSKLPPAFIDLYVRISEWTDVYWYWGRPTAESTGEHLYSTWGEAGDDFIRLFERSAEKFGIQPVIEEIPGKSGSSTPPHPHSVQIHSCHSRQREVEVLHDRLMDLFEQDKTLAPDDVLVQSPAIREYIPFIEAVFGTTENGRPQMPFHIVEKARGGSGEVFRAFIKLLELADSRFKVTEVLDLLANRVVMERFGLEESDFNRYMHWIEGAGIRWGLGPAHRRQMGLPGTGLFSWEYGIDRMMLGYSARLDDSLFNGIFPLDGIESSDDAEMLGRLSNFVDTLNTLHREAEAARSPAGWSGVLQQWVERFIPGQAPYYSGFKGLRETIRELERSSELAGTGREIPFRVVRQYLLQKLEAGSGRGGYMGHGITFCGMEAMRNIPSRVICLLGMNYDDFPRKETTPEFDLMEQFPEPGDPQQRIDDRYLFLEALNAAGEVLYLSYVGQSDRDDSSRPPSVLVSELEGQQAVRHPLHPFSRRYFDPEEQDLFTYSPSMYEVRKALAGQGAEKTPFLSKLPEAGEEYRHITAADLARFFQHPARYLLQKRLGIYFREEEVVTEVREPFELDSLEDYLLGKELFDRVLAGKPLEGYEEVVRSKGMLPSGWTGKKLFRGKSREVGQYGRAVRGLLESPRLDPVETSIENGPVHLTSTLEALFEDYQLLFRYGKMRAKDLVEGWIWHLMLQILTGDAVPAQTLYVFRDKKNRPEIKKFTPTAGETRPLLEELSEMYWEGMHRSTPLFAETSYEYACARLVNGLDHEGAMDKARKAWDNPGNQDWSERYDAYINLLFNERDLQDIQGFTDIALKFWKPLFRHMETVEEG